MEFFWKAEPFSWEGTLRNRLTAVQAKHVILPKTSTPRDNSVMPLSQYTGLSSVGYREMHTVRGHLVGLQFGGPEERNNLVPMYSGFNGGGGLWGTFEKNLRSYLNRRGASVDMEIEVQYRDAETPIPFAFNIKLAPAADGVLPQELQSSAGLLIHTPISFAMDVLSDEDTVLAKKISEWQAKMMSEGWCIEKEPAAVSPGIGAGRLRAGSPAASEVNGDNAVGVRAFYYKARPYSVLDYLWFKHRQEYFALGFPNFPGGTPANTTKFSAGQIRAILKLNTLINEGLLLSDLYGLTSDEKSQILVFNSADMSPEVDHIFRKENGGSNCYSNARVISASVNKQLNRAEARDEVASKLTTLVKGGHAAEYPWQTKGEIPKNPFSL